MIKTEYDEIIFDFEILNICRIIKSIDTQIKIFSRYKDCMFAFNNIADLIYQKQYLLRKYNQFKQILNNFSSEEKSLLYLYFFKNATCFELAEKYGISIRTFFRRISNLNKKYKEIKSKIMKNKG